MVVMMLIVMIFVSVFFIVATTRKSVPGDIVVKLRVDYDHGFLIKRMTDLLVSARCHYDRNVVVAIRMFVSTVPRVGSHDVLCRTL